MDPQELIRLSALLQQRGEIGMGREGRGSHLGWGGVDHDPLNTGDYRAQRLQSRSEAEDPQLTEMLQHRREEARDTEANFLGGRAPEHPRTRTRLPKKLNDQEWYKVCLKQEPHQDGTYVPEILSPPVHPPMPRTRFQLPIPRRPRLPNVLPRQQIEDEDEDGKAPELIVLSSDDEEEEDDAPTTAANAFLRCSIPNLAVRYDILRQLSLRVVVTDSNTMFNVSDAVSGFANAVNPQGFLHFLLRAMTISPMRSTCLNNNINIDVKIAGITPKAPVATTIALELGHYLHEYDETRIRLIASGYVLSD